MSELIRTRCKQGHLVITDEAIRIELSSIRHETLYRSSLTSIEDKIAVYPVFGLGGGVNLTFHGKGGEVLHADLIKPKMAQEIVGLLQRPK